MSTPPHCQPAPSEAAPSPTPTTKVAAAAPTAAGMAPPPQPQHLSHEDYDWMGVLDSLESEHHTLDSCGHVTSAGTATATAMAAARVHYQHQHTAPAVADNNLGNAAVGEGGGAHAGAREAGVLPADNVYPTVVSRAVDYTVPSASVHPKPASRDGAAKKLSADAEASAAGTGGGGGDAASPAPPAACKLLKQSGVNGINNSSMEEAAVDSKKQLRIERKRTREKQRRLDTNSQFAALAEIVREIETTDFVEEAQFNLGKPVGGLECQEIDANGNGKASRDVATTAPAATPAPGPGVPPPSSTPPTVVATATAAASEQTKNLKTDDLNVSSFAGAAAFNPSNRVDLIARTIAQLTQLRIIRRRRTEELTDARRRECETRKEVEELRRLVAHYKAVGMNGGLHRPQEKVMMMVPMMVPQESVSQISAGYPAAHQYAAPSHQVPTAPWMAGMAGTAGPHPMAHTATLSQASVAAVNPFVPSPAGVTGLPPAHRNAAAPATQHSYAPSMASRSSMPPPSNVPPNRAGTSPTELSAPGQQQPLAQESQGSIALDPPSYVNSTLHPQGHGTSLQSIPTTAAALSLPTALVAPPPMMMYPQASGAATSGFTSQAQAAMNNLHQTTHAGHRDSSFISGGDGSAALLPPHGNSHPLTGTIAPPSPPAGPQQQQLPSDKPSPAPHQASGGGGNLAHCA